MGRTITKNRKTTIFPTKLTQLETRLKKDLLITVISSIYKFDCQPRRY